MIGALLAGWHALPGVSVMVPADEDPGWADAAFWAAQLDAWGIPRSEWPVLGDRVERANTTLIVPAHSAEGADAVASFARARHGPGLLVTGSPCPEVAAALGLRRIRPMQVHRARILEPGMRGRAAGAVPDIGREAEFEVETHTIHLDADTADGWEALVRWCDQEGRPGPAAIAWRRGSSTVWFGVPVSALDCRGLEATVACAEVALTLASARGLIAVWRWPHGKTAALVVDGDVDHPTGIDPECSRYVRPALESAARAGFPGYGIFAAAANVEAEPSSFPPAAGYYNHSYHHAYSHWDPRTWDMLTVREIREEITRSNETFLRHLHVNDEGIFRLPHFQLEGFERTYSVLEELGYRADSSIGANVGVTAGLPFHPARRPWSGRPADTAYARTHPDPGGRYPFLQLPISSDPSDPGFAHGCCSYNTLGERVRERTAPPDAYGALLDDVVRRAIMRRGLAHVFIDPPDAGFGRQPGDRVDYASEVESWLRRCMERDDLAVLTTSELATWWLARERAVAGMKLELEGDRLAVGVDLGLPGCTLAMCGPRTPSTIGTHWEILSESVDPGDPFT